MCERGPAHRKPPILMTLYVRGKPVNGTEKGYKIKAMVDTGACTNLMPRPLYVSLLRHGVEFVDNTNPCPAMRTATGELTQTLKLVDLPTVSFNQSMSSVNSLTGVELVDTADPMDTMVLIGQKTLSAWNALVVPGIKTVYLPDQNMKILTKQEPEQMSQAEENACKHLLN